MDKITVMLKHKDSCFYDRRNQVFISGKDPVEVEYTDKVAAGIRHGALIEVRPKAGDEGKKDEGKSKEELDAEKKEEAAKKAHELIKSLSEDKPDYNATDYEVLREWVSTLGLTPASKKKEDYIAALEAEVKAFEADED